MTLDRGIPAWLLIAGAELNVLRRTPSVLIMAAALPTSMGLLIVWGEGDTGRAGWGGAAGLLLVTLVTFTAYVAGTTALAARRQQFVLKRLRTSGASDLAIIAGVLAPLALLTVAQAVVLLGIVAVTQDLPPARPGPLLLATGTATILACVLAVVTAAFTSAPELAQLTTTPIAIAFLGGGFWVVRTAPGDMTWVMAAQPGGAVVHLTRIAWAEFGADGLIPAAVALVLLAVVATTLAIRAFDWDPR